MTATEQPISALPLASSPLPISISSTQYPEFGRDLCDLPRNERALRQGSSLNSIKKSIEHCKDRVSFYDESLKKQIEGLCVPKTLSALIS